MAGNFQKVRLESHSTDQGGDCVILSVLGILFHSELDMIEN